MKRLVNIVLLIGLLTYGDTAYTSTAQDSATNLLNQEISTLALQDPAPVISSMPGWPIPAQPIPHHEPGQPSRSDYATYRTTRLNKQGETEDIELQGLDALLAEGTMTDPLQGNYRLVGLDKVMFGGYNFSPYGNSFATWSFEFVTPTLSLMPGSYMTYGDLRFSAIAAGDLNGDLVDEQIVAWADPSNNKIHMAIGELPGSFGKSTSPAGVIAYPDDSLGIVVRGYDQALWRYDGITWNNEAGGLLASNPAVASREDGMLDVFAVGMDNQVHQIHWSGSDWTTWKQVYTETAFISETIRAVPMLQIPAPAVVASGGTQLDLFRRGSGNTLRWSHSDDGLLWGAWEDLGGMLASGPGAVSLGDGRMQVYALGVDDALWYRTYDDSDWEAWQRLETPGGVARNAAPVLVSPEAGQVTVYLAGTENRIWKNSFNGSSWTAWTSSDAEGELGLGISAAFGPSGTYLFTHMADGSLQYRLNAGGWTSLAGLDVSQNVFDTGAVTKQLLDPIELENAWLHITTGYFSGDGRQQVVLAYYDPQDKLRLEIYDTRDGFRLEKVAEIAKDVLPISGSFPRVAAGDVDGDGVDEIGLAHSANTQECTLRVFKIAETALGITPYVLNQLSEKPIDFMWSDDNFQDKYFYWAGTLRIASGDLVPDNPRTPKDEFVVMSDWYFDWLNDQDILEVYVGALLNIYDYDESGDNTYEWPWEASVASVVEDRTSEQDDWFGPGVYATGFDIAAGNVDGEGLDEIIFTWPNHLEDAFNDGWLDLYRDLHVWGVRVNPDTQKLEFVPKGSFVIPYYSRCTFLDTLAVGDLNLDLKDEIMMAATFFGDFDEQVKWLHVYELEKLSQGPIAGFPLTFYLVPRAFSLVTGDFTGEGLRLGPPTYRLQNRVDSFKAIINLPPKHRDYIKDDFGNYHLVEILTEPCLPDPDDARCTHAKHASLDFVESSTTNKSLRDWSTGGGLDIGQGTAGWFMDLSLKYSYRNVFEAYNETILSSTFNATAMATIHDSIVFYGTPYEVWEYPVYIDDSGVPADFIAVFFPVLDSVGSIPTSPLADTTTGDYPSEPWYIPRHQTFNVWSYDPVGEVRFPDYKPENSILQVENMGGNWGFDYTTGNTTVLITTTTATHDVSAEIGGGYKSSAELPFLGKFGINFRAHVRGTYKDEDIEVDKLQTTESTTLSGWISTQDTSEQFTTKIIGYRSVNGHLVLDYQTNMPTAGVWVALYNHPDPAFTLPWSGFPYGENPSDPTAGLELFSHDIRITPEYASAGETVTISATVRNFSNVAPGQPFLVRFYLGHPDQNQVIGQASVASLERYDGPKTVGITWEATGRGKQKIYAVIDPDNAIAPELHDEDDLINNNMAYNNIQVGAADFGDMGLAGQLPYQGLTYTQTNSLVISAFIPPENLSEIVYFELQDWDLNVAAAAGNPLELAAYLGEEWGSTKAPDLSLQPENTSPPVVITVAYDDSDILGMEEAKLKLWRLDNAGWVEAACMGYESVGFSNDNLLAVPICQTGVFVLSDQRPVQQKIVYLPLVSR